RSWFLVQPSSFEGWGMTVTESNAAGTPVIASNTAGLRDSVLDGQTGILVKTKSVKELARSMIALTEMDGFRERISRNAYDWSRKYSWNVSARLFINILNRESVSPALVEEGSASSVAYLEE
ncbi:MAG: Glycosyl transferase, group 1, partial [Candidatus Woesebacteria bacterium GW2011_GWB1_38_5]